MTKPTFTYAKTKAVYYQQNPLKKLSNNLKQLIDILTKHCKPLQLSLLFLSFYNAKAQTLIPLAESAFESQLPFNTEYIKTNNIKAITFDILDKKDLQVAEDKGLLNYYEFNDLGLIKRFYYTSIAKIIQKEYHSGAVYHRRKKVSNGYSYTKNEYIFDTVSLHLFSFSTLPSG